MSRRGDLLEYADAVKGFMPRDEGLALFEFALAHGERSHRGTWLEVGAWCGKSAVYLGAAAEETSSVLYSLDHHHGSEENQAGWEHFDATLVDPVDGRLNTLPTWQRTIAEAELESTVIGLIGPSMVTAAHFNQPLDILFIDGGHGHGVAWADYAAWTPKVAVGGLLLIHDVFPDPDDGGRPPYEIYRAALESEAFIDHAERGSLRALTRVR
jgi:predicted O-methyltransferase YrrM